MNNNLKLPWYKGEIVSQNLIFYIKSDMISIMYSKNFKEAFIKHFSGHATILNPENTACFKPLSTHPSFNPVMFKTNNVSLICNFKS